jgi:hypothetical protein
MLTATATSDRHDFDPAIEALVPRRSRLRSGVLLVFAFGLIAAVWWSPQVLRPSLGGGDGSAGSWSALQGHDQVLVVARVVADGWNGVDVRRVVPVPGASVAGAWVLAETELDFGVADSGEPSEFPSGVAFATARHPTIGVDTALPQRIPDGATAVLAILWDLDDCALLQRGDQIDGVDVEVRTAIGTAAVTTIHASPGEFHDTLVELGMCPTD